MQFFIQINQEGYITDCIESSHTGYLPVDLPLPLPQGLIGGWYKYLGENEIGYDGLKHDELTELSKLYQKIEEMEIQIAAGQKTYFETIKDALYLSDYETALLLVPEWKPGQRYGGLDEQFLVARAHIPMIYRVAPPLLSEVGREPENWRWQYHPIPRQWEDGSITYATGMTGVPQMVVRFENNFWRYIGHETAIILQTPDIDRILIWELIGPIDEGLPEGAINQSIQPFQK
jgi:hypothetical protein